MIPKDILINLLLGTDTANPRIYKITRGVSNANNHLRAAPHFKRPSHEPQITVPESVRSQLIDRSQSRQILPETIRQKLLRMIAVLHLPFSIVERDEFRDFCLYISPVLRGNNWLPKSGNSIKTWLVEFFLASQLVLIQLLLEVGSKIHVSFDLWSSPNHYSMLGIVYYFIDRNFKACIVILGLKRLIGPHSGENMANLLIETLKVYKLACRLGFCVLDNARDNDISLYTVKDFLLTQGVI